MDRVYFAVGALLGLLGVAAGAFGAHALDHQLSPHQMELFELAVRYQLYHAFALIATAWATTRWPAAAIAAGWFFIIGVAIFCGTVYALSFGAPRWFGAITPIGGLNLLAGWALLVYAAAKGTSYRSTQ